LPMSITRHRWGRYLVAGLVAALALAAITGLLVRRSPRPAVLEPPAVTAIEAQVVRIIDGDTIVVRTGDGREETVRYIGVDAPEIPWDAGDERIYSGPGWAARTANQQLVAGRTVRLELDAQHRDAYGRLLAYVYVGDVMVNARLVEDGLAVALIVPPNDGRKQLFLDAQRAAVLAQRGLWSQAAARAVDWRQAGEHVGMPATVQGVVRRVNVDQGSGIIFLHFGSNTRRDFVALVRPPFTALFPSRPRDYYQGRRVRVQGVVEDFQGQPQIVVQLPAQIEVMD